ncbi:M67 family metallopeptidase [Pectinatus sottacetonis]|uniref:M67 family metallopeptidase n=1 Tax=Pectinatus sottacetonis TaxID=1002795 RepID=UPI001E44EC03|nr:M67 family metallopeptidase [Pectinatus sottacetonis]
MNRQNVRLKGDEMIFLKQSDYDEIVRYAEKNLPEESCGLLGGIADSDKFWVKKVYFLTNTDHNSEHFSMKPEEQFSAVRDMRKFGWKLLGNFHSHPLSPAHPSQEDKRLAFDPDVSYLILSLAQKKPELKSFRIKEKTVHEEKVEILQEES